MRECKDCDELYVEIKKSFVTKVSQWAESYRSGTDGELKAAIKTFYNMKAWHELHIALWVWLSLDGERKKKEWFETFDVPEVMNYCFACEVAERGCIDCPIQQLERNNWWKCANGLYERWVRTRKIAEREKLAGGIANMEWHGQK